MELYDHRGRPLPKRLLTTSRASPTVNIRQAVDTRRVLPGIDAARLSTVLRNAEGGDIYDLLTYADEIERRDLHYGSVLSIRKLAVWGLPMRVEAASDAAADIALADAVRDDLLTKEFFRNIIRDSLDALAKGTSLIEIIWDTSEGQWMPCDSNYVDPRWCTWLRKSPNEPSHGRELWLRTEKEPVGGEPLRGLGQGKWLLHRAHIRSGAGWRDGLMWPISVYFLFKNFAVRDWLSYAEVFGMPVRLGKHQPGATPKDIETLKTAVSQIGSDAGAVIPESMQLEFLGVAGGTGGDFLFQRLSEWLDQQISKGVLGQTLTSEGGASYAHARVHETVRQDVKNADAENLSMTIQKQLIEPFIIYNYGKPKKFPRFIIGEKVTEDLESLSRSLPPFIDRGLRVAESEIRDKFGLVDPDAGETLLEMPQKEPPGAVPQGSSTPPAE